MKISVIIPTINEEDSIGQVIDEIPLDAEIIVVDSNSKDRTVEIARSKGAKVLNEPRLGYGRAYKTGFENATGEIIVALDGDLTYPAYKIKDFIDLLEKENLDFITCDRITNLGKGVMSRKHRFGNFVLNLCTRLLFRIKIKDTQSGMWIFRKEILPKLKLTSDEMAFSEELKIEAWRKGFKCKEVPIEYRVRKGEAKILSWKHGIGNLIFLFKKFFTK
ncbi:MAG: glycosyltransferase family 2 protein [Candidatus Thermoplasmatota archaeon]|nr:glycosyltransferase family 2 protein [Candidatus Thermoplasmatota archaeon]